MVTGQGMAEPLPDQVQVPGNLPLEPGKQQLLFPMCYCTAQIFALESAALPRAPQPRPAVAEKLLTPDTEAGSCSHTNHAPYCREAISLELALCSRDALQELGTLLGAGWGHAATARGACGLC